jgi:hypothetical protein
MAINVKLQGTTVSIHPEAFAVNYGSGQSIEWHPHDNSDEFDFDDPAITFDDANAPITIEPPDGDQASGTDNNQNGTGQDVDYSYHVHLIDSSGGKITYPPINNPTDTGVPVIKNKPS